MLVEAVEPVAASVEPVSTVLAPAVPVPAASARSRTEPRHCTAVAVAHRLVARHTAERWRSFVRPVAASSAPARECNRG